ncbi:16S rRNA (cytosine(1402)-N(4))-methyltransferase RsmH [Kyrpidia tusciae]|uniref:Ribosomal RNA small subunit methyltransferase H n=1 Tax=Kyrpidia tusciae (strain DSM 2912 / NBRC 15312 / T2) TaxID=562970 RepID=D5WQF6_KYRT2|nr:16S rRNA (cytosine(1402)-N(4))-methyltransferase RsmH [Kyrpidia tusciae]ADG06565.1 S-adenosyl-methyltransferase MraW [Kyrpidia tusciae DSM 2912]
MAFRHEPVLLHEVLAILQPRPGGLYVDGTLGGGGHAQAILEAAAPDGRLIGIDQDDEALTASKERLTPYGGRVTTVKGNFRRIKEILWGLGVIEGVDGILLDVGLSSPQVDEAERGFSYRSDAPLDMRMDLSGTLTARDIVNSWPEGELARVVRDYGEERWAARIAKAIVRRRQRQAIETTGELAELVKEAIPAAARRHGPHPARRTFQALRIAVNDELGALEEGVKGALEVLRPGGRLAVIAFHSLEDRIVKRILAEEARSCICPPEAPVCTCGRRPRVRLIGRRPIVPGPEELARNPRARSAKLRGAERLAQE